MAHSVDMVIIGSGIGGLCCGALLARYGFEVLVCESHTIAGGAAHGFSRGGFQFDSGPSLYSGLSAASANPLRHVLEAIGESPDWLTYHTWGCHLPEGRFDTTVGASQFCEVLGQLRGQGAIAQWQHLQRVMAPLASASMAMPSAAVRYDWGVALTAGRYGPALIKQLGQAGRLTGAFGPILNRAVDDAFIRNWMNLLCFLLSGLPADGTSAAEIAFMFADWYRPGVVLDYPVGGSAALVAALVRGLTKFGGKLRLGAHVDKILVQGDRASGVQLRGGEVIQAKRAVVANGSIWNMLPLLPQAAVPQRWRSQRLAMPQCHSFMHLHLGIDGAGVPEDLACHHIVVNDWTKGIDAPQNVVLVSIPSLIDTTLAPPGKQVIHVYTPGNEPYAPWEGLDRRSDDYQRLKAQRANVMWQALERIIPDIRDRCEVTMVGTPLTHERFLRRHRGTYGPAIRAGQALFPGSPTPLAGLYCCGDSTFPGIGLPAVAASGMITANTLAPVGQHLELLRSLQLSA
ncbi:MAG: NAD(P)/FAD-dependent oxidoreductase [Cyanobacteria bacterium P01_H01_bin.119]